MPRKPANPNPNPVEEGKAVGEPRRSTRIKAQPSKDSAKVVKPKPRGKKRKAEVEPNGDAGDAGQPTEKRVRFFF